MHQQSTAAASPTSASVGSRSRQPASMRPARWPVPSSCTATNGRSLTPAVVSLSVSCRCTVSDMDLSVAATQFCQRKRHEVSAVTTAGVSRRGRRAVRRSGAVQLQRLLELSPWAGPARACCWRQGRQAFGSGAPECRAEGRERPPRPGAGARAHRTGRCGGAGRSALFACEKRLVRHRCVARTLSPSGSIPRAASAADRQPPCRRRPRR